MPNPNYRVFQLIKSLGRGGAEVLLATLHPKFNPARFSMRYGFFLPWKFQVAKQLEALGATVVCFKGTNNLAILGKIGKVAGELKNWKADLLHCHLPWAGFVGRVVGRMTGIPALYTEHNKQERYHTVTRVLNRLTFSWQAGVIAVSTDVAESIRKNINPTIPVRIIPNGVDADQFGRSVEDRQGLLTEFGLEQSAQVVGIVAVFRVQKRLDLWLAVARKILDKNPSARFVLVGDGQCRPQVEQAIVKHNLEGAVVLAGLREDTKPFYSLFDIFLMTSEFEGMPIALLEAMATECPVVTTDAGGIPEVVRNGFDGIVLPVRSSADTLADACSSLLQDAAQASKLGRNARQRVVENFTVEVMARKLETYYEEIIVSHGARH